MSWLEISDRSLNWYKLSARSALGLSEVCALPLGIMKWPLFMALVSVIFSMGPLGAKQISSWIRTSTPQRLGGDANRWCWSHLCQNFHSGCWKKVNGSGERIPIGVSANLIHLFRWCYHLHKSTVRPNGRPTGRPVRLEMFRHILHGYMIFLLYQ